MAAQPIFRTAFARQRCGRGEQGAAMVEMALSMVILVTIIFGVMEGCLALYSYHFVSDAAREGSRFAIVRGSACQAPGYECNATAGQIQTYVQNLGFPGINPSNMTVTTAWSAYPAGGTCSPSATCNNPGNLVTVTVKYNFPLSIPFIKSSVISMGSTSAMVISQ
ncbi:MAG: TadE/TadG family type IV pilus assembly protein [Acidobacteriaceae bacterium]